MKKYFLILLSVILLGSSCQKQAAKSSMKAPTRVKTQVVSPGMMDNAQTYVGMVEEREATAVSFTGMGVVKRVLVREGQAVGKGQLIAEMDDTQARNLLSGAEAQMTQANDALERYKMLHDNGSLSQPAEWCRGADDAGQRCIGTLQDAARQWLAARGAVGGGPE